MSEPLPQDEMQDEDVSPAADERAEDQTEIVVADSDDDWSED
jgi:hypothetical protein